MRKQHDLYAQTVGDSYSHLLQIRDGKIYTGDGTPIDLLVGPGSSTTIGTTPGSGEDGGTIDPPPQITVEENVIEEIVISSPSEYLLMLDASPITNKPISVVWNGLYLRKGSSYDYTVSENIITINSDHELDSGDLFTITYWKISYA